MSLLLLLGDTDTNPRSLFANNEPGVFYDPAGNEGASQSKIDSGLTGAAFLAAYPTHSLYTNTTGTSPAVYPGDLVGLQIDQSRGGLGNLGPELVVNGTFAADATWSKGANWSIGSGVATKTGGAANNLTQTISSTAGQWYCVTMDVTRTAGTLTVSLGTSGTSFSTSATGSYKFYILAGSSTQTLTLAGDSSFAGTVDNVTARLIPGTHRYATTDANRPKLARIPEGGRRNLLTYSEQFDNAAWVKDSVVSVTANSATAPNGTETADTITVISNGTYKQLRQLFLLASGSQQTFSCYLKAGTSSIAHVMCSDYISNASGKYFDLSNGTIGGETDLTVGSTVTLNDSSIESVGNGWYRCRVTVTVTASTTFFFVIGVSNANNSTSVTAGKTVFAWGAQLETGSTATAYQRVTLTEDVTETGKRDCWGLWYQGSQSMITPSVDFSGTDKMTVWAGVRKLSDAGPHCIVELSETYGSNNGAFLLIKDTDSPNFQFGSRGTTSIASGSITTPAAPSTNIFAGVGDIAGDIARIRLNGATVQTNTGDQGTGNYGKYPLFFGRRNNSTLPFNGYDFGIIIRGAATTDSTIRAIEKWMARRTGITI